MKQRTLLATKTSIHRDGIPCRKKMSVYTAEKQLCLYTLQKTISSVYAAGKSTAFIRCRNNTFNILCRKNYRLYTLQKKIPFVYAAEKTQPVYAVEKKYGLYTLQKKILSVSVNFISPDKSYADSFTNV